MLKPCCRLFVALLFCIPVLADSTETPAADSTAIIQLKVGDPAPRIAVMDVYENVFNSDSLKPGCWTIISFFGVWCKPCIHEFPDLVKLMKDSSEAVKLIFVSVGQTSREELKTFAHDHDLDSIPVVRDRFKLIRKPFGVADSVPVTFLISPEKRIAVAQYGAFPDGKAYETLQTAMKKDRYE